MSVVQKTPTPNAPQLDGREIGVSAEWGVLGEPRLRRRKHASRAGVALPWDDFATAWSAAEERLARLEQQLSSDLRHWWICRTDFQEAAALAALRGEAVAMDDLVMVDAGEVPGRPTPAWSRARAFLALRRHISRAGATKVLSLEGILNLESRLADFIGESGDAAAICSDGEAIQRWLTAVAGLDDTPALPAAAIALRIWRRSAPLPRYNDEIGLILASTLLWHWGKTRGLTACLAEGGLSLDDRTPLGRWIERFCTAVACAATMGQDRMQTVTRGRADITTLLLRHRANSRLPRLAWLLLAYPVVPARLIQRRLGVTPQGANWLLKELIRYNTIQPTQESAKRRAFTFSY